MDTGASDLDQVVRGRLPNNGGRSNDRFDNRQHKIANKGIPPAMADELSPQEDEQDVSPDNTHEDVQHATNFGANRRMDVVVEDETREELIFQTKSTPLFEKVIGPVNPRRFDGESEFSIQ
jgi:hypothetical protein